MEAKADSLASASTARRQDTANFNAEPERQMCKPGRLHRSRQKAKVKEEKERKEAGREKEEMAKEERITISLHGWNK